MKELIQQLSALNKGANAHTINKAVYYLNNPKAAPSLEPLVRAALANGDWKPVKRHMMTWW